MRRDPALWRRQVTENVDVSLGAVAMECVIRHGFASDLRDMRQREWVSGCRCYASH